MSTGSFMLSYRWRWFKNTGMSIILLWSFAAFAAVNYFVKFFLYNKERFTPMIFSICLLFPIGGWLADVYMGIEELIHAKLNNISLKST